MSFLLILIWKHWIQFIIMKIIYNNCGNLSKVTWFTVSTVCTGKCMLLKVKTWSCQNSVRPIPYFLNIFLWYLQGDYWTPSNKNSNSKCISSRTQKREITSSALGRVQNMDHSQYDAFACVILSHGCRGCVYGVDGEKASIDALTGTYKTAKKKIHWSGERFRSRKRLNGPGNKNYESKNFGAY